MFQYDKPLLNDKQRERILRVKDMLSTGINPYKVPEVTTKVKSVTLNNHDSSKERLGKWLSSNKTPKGAGKWSVDIENGIEVASINIKSVVTDVVNGLICIACSVAIEAVNSTYGKINNGVGRKVVDIIDTDTGLLVERTVIQYPKFVKGYVCKECLDRLYALKYYDALDVLHRGIEILDPPIIKVKESYRMGHREKVHSVPETPVMRDHREDRLPRGKESVLSVTSHIEETEDFIEEWKSELDKLIVEPVDPSAYAYVMGRRGSMR